MHAPKLFTSEKVTVVRNKVKVVWNTAVVRVVD